MMLVLGSLLVAGCGGGNGEEDDGSTETVEDPTAEVEDTTEVEDEPEEDVDDEHTGPTHTSDIQPLWTSRCGPCHLGSGSGGLDLTAGSAYGNIVDVAAFGLPTMDLIEPGSSADSYLYHKVAGTQSSVGGIGESMPFGETLTTDELDLLDRWIGAGAVE
jgi:hypothetical protein